MSFYLKLYDAEPTYRIELIRARLKRSRLKTLAKKLGISEAVLAADLDLRLGKTALLPRAPSERVIGLMTLVGHVVRMVARSGVHDFDAAKWLGAWLNAPLPARPGSYLDTMIGQELLSSLLSYSESQFNGVSTGHIDLKVNSATDPNADISTRHLEDFCFLLSFSPGLVRFH